MILGQKARQIGTAIGACALLAVGGCTDPTPSGPVAASYKPDMATDEGGLWQAMDKEEQDVRESRAVIRDKELNAYIDGVVCRLTPDHCADIRVYIIRTPLFNAQMAPNGMLEIWTGALLRIQNEAQLAAILGHEIGHYLQRHGLQKLRDARAKSDFGAVLALGFTAAGIGVASNATNVILVASMFGFDRDQEREADSIGMQLMTKAGYLPSETPKIWDEIIAENKADKDRQSDDVFFATHPGPEERAETMRRQAAQLPATGEVDAATYQTHLKQFRAMLLADELRLGKYDRTLVVLQTLQTTNGDDGVLEFYTGETYRLRNADGDRERARQAYDKAIALGGFPPELYRSVGLMEFKDSDRADAQQSFEKYLDLQPDAPDRLMILTYIKAEK
jgi:tetratricopeptide (TPR) repeat protein